MPEKALADIGHAKAEAVGATPRISLLQVVGSWFAAVTVFTLNIFLAETGLGAWVVIHAAHQAAVAV